MPLQGIDINFGRVQEAYDAIDLTHALAAAGQLNALDAARFICQVQQAGCHALDVENILKTSLTNYNIPLKAI